MDKHTRCVEAPEAGRAGAQAPLPLSLTSQRVALSVEAVVPGPCVKTLRGGPPCSLPAASRVAAAKLQLFRTIVQQGDHSPCCPGRFASQPGCEPPHIGKTLPPT